MDSTSIVKAVGVEVAKASPPVTVAANQPGGFFSWSPITTLTCVYLVLQIAYLAWKWQNERADRNAERVGGRP
ncbi:hypothetical protein LJR129_003568 [Acidovorax sp. LjRoot129]|uniref:hypothetical protein n=1 Tax=Acidovorax sp. LjRoot129 TaxID=3342260 RepID=UPI003ED11431